MKEGLRGPKGAQSYEILVVCEISQPKIGPCENGHPLKPFIEPYSTDKEEINLLEPQQL